MSLEEVVAQLRSMQAKMIFYMEDEDRSSTIQIACLQLKSLTDLSKTCERDMELRP